MSQTDTTETGESTQVLEFELAAETYCVDIDYVAEIVDIGELTTIPNSPPHVEGVMDLRGNTTTIINPKEVFGVDESGDRKRIIVFDPDTVDGQGSVGWVVDEVDQVVRVDESNVDESPVEDDEFVRGIVKRDEEFTVWIDPETVNEDIN